MKKSRLDCILVILSERMHKPSSKQLRKCYLHSDFINVAGIQKISLSFTVANENNWGEVGIFGGLA